MDIKYISFQKLLREIVIEITTLFVPLIHSIYLVISIINIQLSHGQGMTRGSRGHPHFDTCFLPICLYQPGSKINSYNTKSQ